MSFLGLSEGLPSYRSSFSHQKRTSLFSFFGVISSYLQMVRIQPTKINAAPDPQQLTFTMTKAILETAHEEIKYKHFTLLSWPLSVARGSQVLLAHT
jgi:hypothetical protein